MEELEKIFKKIKNHDKPKENKKNMNLFKALLKCHLIKKENKNDN